LTESLREDDVPISTQGTPTAVYVFTMDTESSPATSITKPASSLKEW